MSGGVGLSESTAMRREESGFPLALEFVRAATPRPSILPTSK